jgi:excisionase family DNA binding protein
MQTLLSPHDLAAALGVSESSLKRWIDAGRIRATRTEGGHRRVSVADALAFVRETHAVVVRPELLGMAAPRVGPMPRAIDSLLGSADEASLARALHDGDVVTLAARIHADQRTGASLAELCDGPIRRAMHAIGDLWRHDPNGVVIEHRATDACVQALASLRAAIPPPLDAPLALGGAPEDDPYMLPSAMAALVLALEGFRTINLGADTPTAAFHRAVAWHQPALIWISASAPVPLAQAHELAAFLTGLPPEVTAVVGGRHAGEIAEADPRVKAAASMAELVALGRAALR